MIALETTVIALETVITLETTVIALETPVIALETPVIALETPVIAFMPRLASYTVYLSAKLLGSQPCSYYEINGPRGSSNLIITKLSS